MTKKSKNIGKMFYKCSTNITSLHDNKPMGDLDVVTSHREWL